MRPGQLQTKRHARLCNIFLKLWEFCVQCQNPQAEMPQGFNKCAFMCCSGDDVLAVLQSALPSFVPNILTEDVLFTSQNVCKVRIGW